MSSIITRQMMLKGRDRTFPNEFTDEISANCDKTIAKASELLSAFGSNRAVSSGWRPKEINKAAGGAPNSLHLYGLAIDILDQDKKLGNWCLVNIDRLVEVGVWMESLVATHVGADSKGVTPWVHWQLQAPKSGSRIFMP